MGGKGKGYGVQWRCKCDCGGERTTRASSLRRGDTTGCAACFGRRKHDEQIIHNPGERKPCSAAGLARHPLRAVWAAMLSRCENPNNPEHRNYGARGVRVCDGWRSLAAFIADMGPRPEDGTVERRDNGAGYTCGHCDDCKARGTVANCRWATQREQGRNKRTNRMVTLGDKTLCVADWIEATGIGKSTLWGRLNKGWSVERALSTPVRRSP